MRNLTWAILILAFSMSATAQRYSDSTWIIGAGHIGKVCINMDEKKLPTIFEASQIKADKKSEEGSDYSIINITLDSDKKVSLELETMCIDICLISRIQLFSSKFKTVKGIGVGNTVGDLKKNYSLSTIVGGEKGILIYTDDIPQTAFVVNIPSLKPRPDKSYTETQLPDDAKIEWIYMY